jgi:ribosomal protein L28
MHVASGVAVGERVHVERIDLGGLATEARGRGLDDAQEGASIPSCYDGRNLAQQFHFPTRRSTAMPRACAICGKHAAYGYNVSHSKVHTHRRFDINLQSAIIDGTKMLVCTRCRRTSTKPARMAEKRAKKARTRPR